MPRIVILGAGRSTPYLIRRMVDQALSKNWDVTVADMDVDQARKRIGDSGKAVAVELNATEEPELQRVIQGADVVANLLAPRFQAPVARNCVEAGAHMVSVSYLSDETRELDAWAKEKGVMLLTEMGLDPGIDHMMAMEAVSQVRRDGGRILSFRSFGSGVPAEKSVANPMDYLITWNPWNVAMSGKAGAQYMLDGHIRIVPHRRLFLHTWPVEVEDVGRLEAYPNRDSLSYRDHFHLDDVRTMIRGTLRWPGYCETWAKIVKLGIPNDSLHIPDLASRSPRDVVAMFLPIPVAPELVEEAATLFLELNPTGEIMEKLRFLGLFDEEACGAPGSTAAEMLSHLLQQRLAPKEGDRDMVILVHQMDVQYDRGEHPCERLTYTMVDRGDACGLSAMARTVGLPTALAMEMMLEGELDLPGCILPTEEKIYPAVLARLRAEGLKFKMSHENGENCERARRLR